MKQTGRLFHLDTPLGEDVLLVRRVTGEENISGLFHYELELVSDDFDVSFDQLVGKPVTLGIRQSDDESFRYLNGIVSKFALSSAEGRLAVYKAEVVPWLWLLTQTWDCRIYQDMEALAVIKDTFQRLGFQSGSDWEDQTTLKRTPWAYCTQYRETACDFVKRLMEIEGIFFFFRHEQDRHVLVMADAPSANKPCPYQSRMKYEYSFGRGYKSSEDSILEWRFHNEFKPGKYTQRDYNFRHPTRSLQAEAPSRIRQGGNDKYEVYDYPGSYEIQTDGDEWTRMRIEEEETPHAIATGKSNCRSMYAGFRFDLYNHDRRDQNMTWLITSVKMTGEEGTFVGGSDKGEGTYENTFTAIPYSVPYRPERKTTLSQMMGTQTARVVGPEGEEIYTDEFGRVKVKFHWDRSSDESNSSVWIRVAQPWAGANWGYMWIPRIGQEVIVDFMEGDPDRPMIIGRVYNGDNMPPYKLPDKKNHSGIRSHSTKGGGGDNFNEIHFDDTKGKELFSMQSEYNKADMVKNDELEEIRHDRFLRVKNNQVEDVENDKKSHVTGNFDEGVNGKISIKVDGDYQLVIGGDYKQKVSGNWIRNVDGDSNATVNGSEQVRVNGDVKLSVSGELHITAARILLTAQGELCLSCGGSSIDLNPGTIGITGAMVLINSGGMSSQASPASPDGGSFPDPDLGHVPALDDMGDLGGLGGQAASDSPSPSPTSSGGGDGGDIDSGVSDSYDVDLDAV
ncbi:MAG TPA: type VI secretion system tip protein TssI/VgrG [Bryobacteraceae bacterium]|nr:type VI secretion system tip protein TssI/VgrG [Bryobacteraceae bacterium]